MYIADDAMVWLVFSSSRGYGSAHDTVVIVAQHGTVPLPYCDNFMADTLL